MKSITAALKRLFGLEGNYKTIADVLDDAEISGGLPEVTSDDNGDILKVVEGAWAKGDPPAGLPAVTTSDKFKGMRVISSGQWEKSNTVAVITKDYQNSTQMLEIQMVCYDDTTFEWVRYLGTMLPKKHNNNKGKTIRGNSSNGAWELVDFPIGLPTPSAAQAGYIVKVNAAGDGYELAAP